MAHTASTTPSLFEVKHGIWPVLNFIEGVGPTIDVAGDSLTRGLFQGYAHDNTQVFVMGGRSRMDRENENSLEHPAETVQLYVDLCA